MWVFSLCMLRPYSLAVCTYLRRCQGRSVLELPSFRSRSAANCMEQSFMKNKSRNSPLVTELEDCLPVFTSQPPVPIPKNAKTVNIISTSVFKVNFNIIRPRNAWVFQVVFFLPDVPSNRSLKIIIIIIMNH